MLTLLFWLLVGHAVCDYPLQGDFLARAKNHTAPIPGVPWRQALGAHALIHAGAVAFLTGSVVLGSAEFFAHCLIDWLKCDLGQRVRARVNNDPRAAEVADEILFSWDQAAHMGCKVLWALLAVWVLR